MFEEIAHINKWLDDSNESSQHEDSMRIMKIGEEYGEAVQAYIGMLAQNPRKGVTHTKDDVLNELADVAVTALCAIQHFTQDKEYTAHIFYQKLISIIKRAGIGDGTYNY